MSISKVSSAVGVEGKDGEMTDLPGNNYGNATYFISPDGSATDQIEVYRGSGLGGERISSEDYIKVGDEVIVYGILTLYGSTPEITQGSKIYYLNGQTKEVEEKKSDVDPAGSGTKEDPYNVAGAQQVIDRVGNSESDFIYVQGIISQIDEINENYGNATYYISDDGTTVGQLEVYRGFGLGGEKLADGDIHVGDNVIVYGKVINYNNKTREFTSGSKLYSLNGVTKEVEEQMGEAKGSGTLEDPYNPAGAAQAVKDLSWTSSTEYQKTGEVYVKGKISRIANNGTFTQGGTYGNASFYISEDGSQTGEFYCYRILYLGNKKYESGQPDIKVGDEVVICGKLMNYRGNTPETVAGEAYLFSLNGVSESGGGGTHAEAKGSGTLEDPYNPAGATQAASGLTWTSTTDYQKTDVVYVKGIISRIANKGTFTEGGTYGNASFYISEDGTESDEFYCFRVLYLGNKKYESGQTDIKVGDEVVICGKLMNYRNNTPETVAGEAYLYSLNSNGGGGDNPPVLETEGEGNLNSPYTVNDVKAIYDANAASSDKVFVKGYIVGYVDGSAKTVGEGARFAIDPTVAPTVSNLLVAASPRESDVTKCIPVQLPTENNAPGIREGLNLKDHPENLGLEITLYGTITKYFDYGGVKNVTYAITTGGIYGVNPSDAAKRRVRK